MCYLKFHLFYTDNVCAFVTNSISGKVRHILIFLTKSEKKCWIDKMLMDYLWVLNLLTLMLVPTLLFLSFNYYKLLSFFLNGELYLINLSAKIWFLTRGKRGLAFSDFFWKEREEGKQFFVWRGARGVLQIPIFNWHHIWAAPYYVYDINIHKRNHLKN